MVHWGSAALSASGG